MEDDKITRGEEDEGSVSVLCARVPFLPNASGLAALAFAYNLGHQSGPPWVGDGQLPAEPTTDAGRGRSKYAVEPPRDLERD